LPPLLQMGLQDCIEMHHYIAYSPIYWIFQNRLLTLVL
jgi:hypothetical protein